MPSTFTTSCRFELQETGTNLNVWGNVLNTRAIDLIDQAVDGFATVNLASATTFDLSSATYTKNGESDTSRRRVLRFTNSHASGTAITIPSVTKNYWIINAGSYPITLAPSGSLTPASVPAGASAFVWTDGTDCFVFRSRLNELAAPNGAVSMNSQKLTNVADAVDNGDAVNKAQAIAITAADAQLAKDWAQKVSGFVTGSDNSAKSWAIGGTGNGQPTAGDAKSWATSTSTVAGGLKGARGYASDASTSAGAASTSAGAASTSATNALNSEIGASTWATSTGVVSGGFLGSRGYAEAAAATLADFEDKYVNNAGAGTFPASGNFSGRVAWSGSAFGVYNGSGWDALTSTPAASETVQGIIEIATQPETDAGTDDNRAVTSKKLANYSGFSAIDARFDDIEAGLVAGSSVPTTTGSSVDFVNLDCDEFHLLLNAVSTVSGASIQLAFSTNNGSSWSTAIQVIGSNTGASAPKTDSVRVLGLKSGQIVTLGGGIIASSLPSAGNSGYVGRVNAGGAVNAVRLSLSASTFNGGSITPFMAV